MRPQAGSASDSSISRGCSSAWRCSTRAVVGAVLGDAASHAADTARTSGARRRPSRAARRRRPTRSARAAPGRPRRSGRRSAAGRRRGGRPEPPRSYAASSQHDADADLPRRGTASRPARSAARRACRRAGGARSGTRRRPCSPPAACVKHAARRRRCRAGSSAPAAAYIASRHVQKSSSGARCERASTSPRRSRWKACECTFTKPGDERGARQPHGVGGASPARRRRPGPRWCRRPIDDDGEIRGARRLARARPRARAACGHGSIGRSSPRGPRVLERLVVAGVGVSHDARARDRS